jgi:hypothetical protein
VADVCDAAHLQCTVQLLVRGHVFNAARAQIEGGVSSLASSCASAGAICAHIRGRLPVGWGYERHDHAVAVVPGAAVRRRLPRLPRRAAAAFPPRHFSCPGALRARRVLPRCRRAFEVVLKFELLKRPQPALFVILSLKLLRHLGRELHDQQLLLRLRILFLPPQTHWVHAAQHPVVAGTIHR